MFCKLLLVVTGNGFLYGLQFSSFLYLGCKWMWRFYHLLLNWWIFSYVDVHHRFEKFDIIVFSEDFICLSLFSELFLTWCINFEVLCPMLIMPLWGSEFWAEWTSVLQTHICMFLCSLPTVVQSVVPADPFLLCCCFTRWTCFVTAHFFFSSLVGYFVHISLI